MPSDTSPARANPLPSTIAIDGPAASGKSTVGYALAAALDYLYFDTGVVYRAVTWLALSRGIAIEDEAAVCSLAETVQIDVLEPTDADDGRLATVTADGRDMTWDIRRPEVDAAVSAVSAYPCVRRALTAQQRRIGHAGSVVMVGRDIGSVVMPDAGLKIYLDASVEERARRRCQEARARGEVVSYDEVLGAMRRRDRFDSSRATAPLRVASGAVVIDSTHLDVGQVLTAVLELLEAGQTPVSVRAAASPGDVA